MADHTALVELQLSEPETSTDLMFDTSPPPLAEGAWKPYPLEGPDANDLLNEAHMFVQLQHDYGQVPLAWRITVDGTVVESG